MAGDFYKKLCLAVYRVTDLFPEGEPLKVQIRESANRILTDLTEEQYENIFPNLRVINSLFDLAQAQNWVDDRNFLVLRREYNKIEKLIKKETKLSYGKTVEKTRITQNRKEKILDVLQEKKKIKVGELIQNFPRISRRTLIRDLEELYRSGVVIKIGSGRATCYNIKL